ncbi:MAG: hypothetical protein ACOYXC_16365 [Candidatus Rifleibacteriota bacterium]
MKQGRPLSGTKQIIRLLESGNEKNEDAEEMPRQLISRFAMVNDNKMN